MPINGNRLREVLETHGRSTNDLAKSLKDSQQTLQLITTGKTRRCRRSRRDAIAKELGVPADWLGGELPQLPFVTHLQRRIRSSEAQAQALEEFEVPTAGQVALSAFCQLCFEALRREMPHAWPSDVEKGRRAGYEQLQGLVFDAKWGEGARLLNVLAGLLNPYRWQEQLLWWRNDADESELSQEDMEKAMGAFARAFEVVLRPWFEGKCLLDVEGLMGASEQAAVKSKQALFRELGAHGDARQFAIASPETQE